MYNLEIKTDKVIDECKELMKDYVKMLGVDSMDLFKDMDFDTFNILRRSVKLMDSAYDLMSAQAQTIDSLNRKLDKVLEHLEKMEKES